MARYPQIEELLGRAQSAMGSREYSRRTRSAYTAWLKQFLLFHKCPQPSTLDQRHAEQFLEYLEAKRNLAAKTRNQAASAIAFLYRDGCDIRILQKLMGHADVRTTMIYLHATDQIGIGLRSPIDRLIDQGGGPG